jgi:hypothetical protein
VTFSHRGLTEIAPKMHLKSLHGPLGGESENQMNLEFIKSGKHGLQPAKAGKARGWDAYEGVCPPRLGATKRN